jgi:ubiquinone/menaquinone biosynthesis C-methylase UbiE
MSQAKNDEISFFNEVVEDLRREEITVNNLESFIENVYDILKLRHPVKDEIILDAGCGSGAWGIKLASNGYVVVGADISKVQVKQARDKAKLANVMFMPILCDLERLPLKEQAFQLCICGYVLHHFRSLDDILPEISRILETQGSVIIIDPNGSNIVHTLIRNIESLFPRSWFMNKHIATSNEMVHDVKFYLKALKKTKFNSISYGLKNANVPKYSHFNLFVILVSIRSTILELCKKLLPGLNGKTEIILIASKRAGLTRS